MLVKCPNCSLEQPKDEFCARCGRNLTELIQKAAFEKSQQDRKTSILIGLSFLLFFGCLIIYVSINRHLNSVNSLDLSIDEGDPVQYKMRKAKINRPPPAPIKRPSENKEISQKRTEQIKPAPVAAEPVFEKITDEPQTKKSLVQKFALVSLESCPERLKEMKNFSRAELTEIEGCYLKFYEFQNPSTDLVLESAQTYEIRVTSSQEGKNLSISFIIASMDDNALISQRFVVDDVTPDIFAHRMKVTPTQNTQPEKNLNDEILSSPVLPSLLNLPVGEEPPLNLFIISYLGQ